MSASASWKYLARKPRSVYKQLFVKDRWIAARTLYGQTLGEGARTPQVLATDYDVPLEAVLEALAYCESNPPEIHEDWAREESSIQGGCRDSAAGNGRTPPPNTSSATAATKLS